MDSWKHLQGQFLGSLSQLAESNLRPAATYMERIIPNSIRDQLPALPDSISKFSQVRQTINKHIQKETVEEPWHPLSEEEIITALPNPHGMSKNPLCCRDAVPISFRHLLELLPANTFHNTRPASGSVGPLVASLMGAVVMSDAIPAAASLLSYSGIFYAVVEVSILHPTTTPQKNQPKFASGKTQPNSSTSENIPTTVVSTNYFVPIEERNTDTPSILAMKTPFHCRRWRQIRQDEADETVRKREMDIVIGDGEVWTEMKGREKIWCEGCGVWCVLRGWVRED